MVSTGHVDVLKMLDPSDPSWRPQAQRTLALLGADDYRGLAEGLSTP